MNNSANFKANNFSWETLRTSSMCNSQDTCKIVDLNSVSHVLQTYIENLQRSSVISQTENRFVTSNSIPDHENEERKCKTRTVLSDCQLKKTDHLIQNSPSADSTLNRTHGKEKISFDGKQYSHKNQIQKETVSEAKKSDSGKRKNSEDRPHQCEKCEKSFKRKLHLKQHIAVAHSEEKNFRCNVCFKSFSRKDYLIKHMRGHKIRDLKLKLLEKGIVVRTKTKIKIDQTIKNPREKSLID